MARVTGRKDLRDDEILRFLRFEVTESAAATYTEGHYDTLLSIDRGLVWMIHFVEWEMFFVDMDDVGAAAVETTEAQILRESKTDIVAFHDADLIARFALNWKRVAAIGTDAGPGYIHDITPYQQLYIPPLVFAATNVHIGVKASGAAAKMVRGRIGYTLRRVSDKFFYRVAQALIS